MVEKGRGGGVILLFCLLGVSLLGFGGNEYME